MAAIITDAPPRNGNRTRFLESDLIKTLDLPEQGCLLTTTTTIQSAMQTGKTADVRRACTEFLEEASRSYGVPMCGIRVLAARPLRVRERWTTELFGDYHVESMAIRLWMRTATRKDITSFGTFLSTLCHEFCHHLDVHSFKFADSWHTRGFYEHCRSLPPCAGNAVQTAILGFGTRWTLENRLAADESGHLSGFVVD